MPVRPRLSEAVKLLASRDGDARAIAGGQSLMPMLAFRVVAPALLVDLRKLAELQGDQDRRRRRAPRRHGALARHRGRRAARHRASAAEGRGRARRALPDPQPRHRRRQHRPCRPGGGDARHRASPATPRSSVTGTNGARTIRADDFFVGALTTALEPDEIITEIKLPAWPAKRRWGFREFARRRGDFAMAAAALFYDQDAGGKATNAHVGIIGLGDRPRRLPEVEAAINGQRGRRSLDGARRRGHLGERSRRRRTSTPAPHIAARSPAPWSSAPCGTPPNDNKQ